MISEQEKQAILDGAYGITAGGKKVKYIGKRELAEGEYAFPYFFVILSENGNISRSTYLSEDLTYALGDGNIHEVVGLWEEKLEPLDIKRALAGEPVRLRGNKKAYVKYLMPDEYTGSHPVKGYIIDASNVGVFTFGWCLDGRAVKENYDHHLDIVSMWKEPEPVSNTVTVTLPRALKEPQDVMWFITPEGYKKSSYGKNIPSDVFGNRYYFSSEEDAKAWYEAVEYSRQ